MQAHGTERRLRRLDRPHRGARRHDHRRAGGGARRDPRPRRSAAAARARTLPPLWHWLYFLPVQRQSELGADGHPRRGGFLPPVRAAAPHVGGRPADASTAAAARRRRGDAHARGSPTSPARRRAPGRSSSSPCEHEIATATRRRPARGARHRLPRPAGAGRATADRRRARRPTRRFARDDRPRRRAPVPLLGADLQRPPHPLRPPLRDRGRGLSGPGRARAADRDAAARPAAPRAAGGARRVVRASRRVSPLFDLAAASASAAAPTASGRFALWARNADGGLAMQASASIA